MKDRGNAQLESGRAQEAAEQYSIALLRLKEVAVALETSESSSLKALLLGNRSQAYLKLLSWEKAMEDAENCLRLQPDNSKAKHRLRLATEALKEQELRQRQGEALKQGLFCKMKGNELLTSKHFEAAISKYTEGLEWLEDESGAAPVKLL